MNCVSDYTLFIKSYTLLIYSYTLISCISISSQVSLLLLKFGSSLADHGCRHLLAVVLRVQVYGAMGLSSTFVGLSDSRRQASMRGKPSGQSYSVLPKSQHDRRRLGLDVGKLQRRLQAPVALIDLDLVGVAQVVDAIKQLGHRVLVTTNTKVLATEPFQLHLLQYAGVTAQHLTEKLVQVGGF